MHPTLKPALRRSWRDRQTLQFGVDPARAMVLGPLDEAASRFLRLLDGTRGPALLLREAERLGLTRKRAGRLLDALTDGGVLDDADSVDRLVGLRGRPEALARLRPDLASLSVLHRRAGAATALMAARRAARVLVRGAGRVGASVAAVLAAGGVGQVDVVDSGRVELWDTAPAGVSAAQVGERRGPAARDAVRRVWPDPRSAPRRPGPEPALSLAVLAPRDGLGAYAPDPRTAEPLVAAGIPHLYAGVVEGVGCVGPLVVPGRTGCAGCLEAERAERDPAWPRIVAQLRSGDPPEVVACDVALATVVAGLAAARALAFLDWLAGGETQPGGGAADGLPPGAGSRTEFALADLGIREYAVMPHPGCQCGAAHTETRVTMAM